MPRSFLVLIVLVYSLISVIIICIKLSSCWHYIIIIVWWYQKVPLGLNSVEVAIGNPSRLISYLSTWNELSLISIIWNIWWRLLLLLSVSMYFSMPSVQYFSVDTPETKKTWYCQGECYTQTNEKGNQILHILRLRHITLGVRAGCRRNVCNAQRTGQQYTFSRIYERCAEVFDSKYRFSIYSRIQLAKVIIFHFSLMPGHLT